MWIQWSAGSEKASALEGEQIAREHGHLRHRGRLSGIGVRLAFMENIEPELAFYYPNPVWRDGNWVKNLLLFFDGIALLVPEYLREKPFQSDPAISEGLSEAGLLTILEPESFLDKRATERLATAMAGIIESGSLDGLSPDTAFHELSWSRLGGRADPDLASAIYRALKKRHLAKPSSDGASIPMHPLVRSLVLVLLSQILRTTGREQGLDLQPATDRPEIHHALRDILGAPLSPSAGHVVSLDLATVGIDLSSVPLDEVLGFRTQHRKEYRAYARDLRRFVRDLSTLDELEQRREMHDRQDEMREQAESLKKHARAAWKHPGSFALALAGAAWAAHSGDLLGALLAGGDALLGASDRQTVAVEAYSYLFQARALA